LFAYFSIGAILVKPRDQTSVLEYQRFFTSNPMFVVGIALAAALIGFRFEVGGDWAAYLELLEISRFQDLASALSNIGDPGYSLLNWIAGQIGAGIWFVNSVCGIIFCWGLAKFAARQPSPWLAVTVAVPYLMIVVAMGYTRQGVAIGFIMAGLASRLSGGSILRLGIYVALAALFHKTAVVIFPLVALSAKRNRFTNIAVVLVSGYFLYNVFLAGSEQRFIAGYIEDTHYVSQGAPVRVAMNVLPAAILLLFSKRFDFTPEERLIWRNFSWFSLILGLALLITSASTAVDRIALYMIPLQLAVLSRIPTCVVRRGSGLALVIGYLIAAQFMWLNFATYSRLWLPYRIYGLS
jgi:hypothetical protein